MVSPAQPSLFASLHDRDRAPLGRRLGLHCPLVLTFDEVDSTNEQARNLAKQGAPHGSVVLAERQTSGRGRWKREWVSPSGGLYLSIILRAIPAAVAQGELSRLPLVPHLVAVAAAEAIQERTGVATEIRWPNDLFVDGRKLGGILCESALTGSRLDFAVAGIGVNVHQSAQDFGHPLSEKATSLRLARASGVDRLALAAALAERVTHWWRAGAEDPHACLDRWRELSPGTKGARVRVEPREGPAFDARCLGLADDGALLVELVDGGERRLYAEEIVFLRASSS